MRIMNKTMISTVAMATALSFASTGAYAQDQQKAAGAKAKKDDKAVEEIVVLGTPGGAGVKKMDASFAITTMNQDQVDQAGPKSTAEVLTLVPGVWTESSGGVAGANIDVRGLPGGGDAPFVTMAINGAPIYGTEMLSFMEQSSLFRVDETIRTTEALRGGPNAVFSNGEPGVTMNFNLKKGGDNTEGRVKYTASDYGSNRVDAVLSGPLGNGLYYMVGGYVRSSPGIRDAQFNSEKGHQITAELTKEFDNGEVNVFSRVTDDHGQWYLPQALNSGNDLGTFSQLGNATRFATLQVNANGDMKTYDFANGRGWKGSVSGLNANFDLGDGWSVKDNMSYTKGDADTYGFVPDGGAIQVKDLAAGTATTTGGDVLGGNEWIQNYGHWVVQKQIESFTNDLSIAKTVGDHDFTFGFYKASWSSDDFWSLGNFAPVHNVQNGDSLDGTSCQDLQAAGSGSGCWAYGIQSAGEAKANAIYGADSWQINDRLRFDIGLRQQWLALDYVLDSGPGYPDGTRDLDTHLTTNAFSYTGALNYDVSEDLGVFVRYSKGSRFPNFDDIRNGGGTAAIFGIKQLEGGIKYSSDNVGLFATVFYNKNDSFSGVVGSTIPNEAFKTRALGVELDGHVTYGAFNLAFIGTLQDAKITASSTAANIDNQVLRQPKWQFRLAPSYDIPVGSATATIYGAAQFVGDRWGDNANTNKLSGYTKIDMGVKVTMESGLFFHVHADNLNNSHGLTEADPRSAASPNGRAILGRSINFSVGYDF
ncbi:TonB-dependent receptor [Kordiimonas marina]|uniref:TonB-dependent receptor n=1 Tax=Kordiimonas marina TaxID=2872312 RepID=UPI001FF5E923|nr:TonB-dependent receptor [Kordiimonas marina]MCJ9430675.1 TonB-dependent receptor [Kordiimonas marina]